ncbi:MAG: HEPN domain-containing protein, partial [Promethearchaeota archaeon]
NKMARSSLKEASIRFQTAKKALNDRFFPYAVRQSQECVELALKGALRLVGIEPPKWHDVGIILKKNKQKFPQWFQQDIDKMAFISRELRKEREISMYGDNELNLTPDEIYSAHDAETAVKNAEFILNTCKKLIS